MLYRFPPPPAEAKDPSFIVGATETFAKLKIESKPGQRTVLMTEHTLIFVTKGIKLLHFGEETLKVSPNEVFLLKKGIYVMAEHLEDGLDFEALMLFLPAKILRSFLTTHSKQRQAVSIDPYLVFPAESLLKAFREQLRLLFDNRQLDFDRLLPIKQQEVICLLLSSPYGQPVAGFIKDALTTLPEDLEYVMKTYLFQPVSLAELAGLANRSLAALKRDSQRLFGMPPRTWINLQRLEHSQLLLANTSKTVTAIGFECGFESPSHFIRSFKKAYGYTPNSRRAKVNII